MKKQIKVSILFTLISTVSLGVIYPTLLAAVGLLIPASSRSSLLEPTQSNDLFQGRPSMSGGSYSGASNLSLTSLELAKQVDVRLKRLRGNSPGVLVPRDLLFASASGYDPDISLEGALNQISRIAKVRKLDRGLLKQLVDQHSHSKFLGFIGTEMVNVIALNTDLEQRAPKLSAAP